MNLIQNTGPYAEELDLLGFASPEAERYLIGALCLRPELAAAVMEIVHPEDFYVPMYRSLFQGILEVFQKNGSTDFPQLLDWLRRKRPEDYQEDKTVLRDIMNEACTAGGVMEYAQLVKQASIQRQAAEIARELQEGAEAGGFLSAEEQVTQVVERLNSLLVKQGRTQLGDVADEIVPYLERLSHETPPERFRTGFSRLDGILGGLSRTDLAIVAARPAVGKSTFALNLAVNLLKQSKRVALFTLEMSREQIIDKLISLIGGIPLNLLRERRLGPRFNEAALAADFLAKSGRLYVDDTSGITIPQIKARCMAKKPDVIIIDYLQLLTPARKTDNQNQAVAELSRNLKILAGELNCAVVCLSQLNRAVEARQNGRPTLADLRDSGAIEQDANMVLFLSREKREDPESPIVVEVAKNRLGACGTSIMAFDGNLNRFCEMERNYQPPQERARKLQKVEI